MQPVACQRLRLGLTFCGFELFVFSAGLVVAFRVDGQFAEEFSGGGVDDGDVEVVDEEFEVGSGVGSTDADVV